MDASRPSGDELFPGRELDVGLTRLLGISVVSADADRVELAWPVTPELHQPWGIQHGGVLCAAVETAASIGAGLFFGEQGTVVGVNNSTDFLRAVRDGRLTAVATPVHRGRTQQLWQVEVRDEAQRLVARGQVRLQNIPDRAAGRD